MKCPTCGSDNCIVMDSRPVEKSRRKRRYICNSCGIRFNTVEVREVDISEIVNGEWIAEMQRHYRTMQKIKRECLLRAERLLK